MEFVYPPVVAAITGLFKVMGWQVRVRGSAHLPEHGAGVIATNHVGYLDFIVVGFGARQRHRLVRFLAKQEIFDHPVAGPLMRGMHHIPVDRFGRAADALEASVAALRAGELIGMFPEGTISRALLPAAGKSGAARMAMAAGAPLIPGAVWGSQRILTKGRSPNLKRGVAMTVDFGAPVEYSADETPEVVTKRLMTRIGELLDGAIAAYPQRPSGDSDRWWLPATLGGSAPTVAESEQMAAQERRERRERRRQLRDRPTG
jgi:1-acyl-sn-glycerol-3-phosphate acyltransferase